MVSEIRIYVEGGGMGGESKARFREGFGHFLAEIVEVVRAKRIRWSIVASGSRREAYKDFLTALETHPDAFNVLLVDSEGPVDTVPPKHLEARDGWDLSGIDDERCQLMVQMMEAWLVADPEALRGFYGHDFNLGAMPKNPDVEAVDKKTIAASLDAATKNTTKGRYHKIRHGPQLLAKLDAGTVRKRARHCDRLFAMLTEKIGADS